MTLVLCLSVTFAAAVLLFTCAGPIVKAFIDDAETVRYGSVFQRIICITGPFTAITIVIITIFQSVGQKLKPLILSMMRKGGLDVPFMFLMNMLAGVNGIAWSTPMADCCAMLTGIILLFRFGKSCGLRKMNFPLKNSNNESKFAGPKCQLFKYFLIATDDFPSHNTILQYRRSILLEPAGCMEAV